MEKDLKSSLNVSVGLNFQTIATDTTTNGVIIDTVGNESLTFGLITGTITDGDYAVTIQHGDDSGLSDATTAGSDDLIGTLPSFTDNGDDDKAAIVGYVGKKRYVRANIVSTNTTSGGVVGVVAIKGHATSRPTS